MTDIWTEALEESCVSVPIGAKVGAGVTYAGSGGAGGNSHFGGGGRNA